MMDLSKHGFEQIFTFLRRYSHFTLLGYTWRGRNHSLSELLRV